MSEVQANLLPLPTRAKRNDPTLPVILEFQQPSTAIINAPVPRSARGTIWIVSSMVAAMVLVAGVLPVDQVITARGLVVSQSSTILVQPLETAIVRSIDVSEGQHVRAGDVLARLDPTFAEADRVALEGQLNSLEPELARLRAEADGQPFTYSGDDPNWALQASIFSHRKAQFDSKIENYEHRLQELNSVIARSESDAVGYRERLGVAQSIEDMRKQLEATQTGSRLNSLIAKDTRVEMQRSLSNAVATGEGAKRDQSALASDRDAYVRGWKAEASQKLQEISVKAADTRELLTKANLRRKLVEIRAGLDAIVQSVAKVSVGSVMQSGQQFITLVPADAPLEVEANIAGKDNGFVHVKDPVSVKFDTFPFSQYGMAEGAVRIVSPDSFNAQVEARNPTSAIPTTNLEPFYRTRISIDRVALHGVPAGFQLTPGMPVTADIKVGQRTVLTYMLGLMLPVTQEALREP
ncbi:hemolysin D [Bradyrhizobium sp. USDA 3240]|uniref:HlyD family type I secretion periplasmic adaptor subunit n=1 Tax=Bradyrhizobium sp. RD5-C2 TaxID=244562 RepID=UPI001CC52424|nr:HlyD family type I secretion periplasmic adaptor subunit [Bradyrhizobium sp. RD5-C2]GIQ71978.1 HlyD family type I secretion periplasmic adaptor subunit [Bradyrhizobium sp. RD5-C2]